MINQMLKSRNNKFSLGINDNGFTLFSVGTQGDITTLLDASMLFSQEDSWIELQLSSSLKNFEKYIDLKNESIVFGIRLITED